MFGTPPPPLSPIHTFTSHTTGAQIKHLDNNAMDAFVHWTSNAVQRHEAELHNMAARMANLEKSYTENLRLLDFVGKHHPEVIHEYLSVQKVNRAMDKALYPQEAEGMAYPQTASS